jgi:hypothetical protein
MIDNGQRFPSVNSLDGRVTADNGSHDVYLGLARPDVPEANCVRIYPGKGYPLRLHFYGPTAPFFDLSWIPEERRQDRLIANQRRRQDRLIANQRRRHAG